jgi:hypothetical protein
LIYSPFLKERIIPLLLLNVSVLYFRFSSYLAYVEYICLTNDCLRGKTWDKIVTTKQPYPWNFSRSFVLKFCTNVYENEYLYVKYKSAITIYDILNLTYVKHDLLWKYKHVSLRVIVDISNSSTEKNTRGGANILLDKQIIQCQIILFLFIIILIIYKWHNIYYLLIKIYLSFSHI